MVLGSLLVSGAYCVSLVFLWSYGFAASTGSEVILTYQEVGAVFWSIPQLGLSARTWMFGPAIWPGVLHSVMVGTRLSQKY